MKKYLYLLVAIVCMGFAGCGGSDDNDITTPSETTGNNDGKTQNADLAGWWISDLIGSSASPNVGCWALRFLDDNIIQSTFLVIEKSIYGGGYSNEDVGDYVFTYNSTKYFYSKQNTVKTYVYERNGNVISIQATMYNNNIVLIDGKLKWEDIEYFKVAN